jgi:hypothetical protein
VKLSSIQFAGLVVIALLAHSAEAKNSLKSNSDASQRAISSLLAVSDEVIPTASTCHGAFGGSGPAKVRDLLAMELATFSRGTNTLVGACKASTAGPALACHVAIAHEFGEEASSAEIRFQVQDGRAVVSSLDCRLAP